MSSSPGKINPLKKTMVLSHDEEDIEVENFVRDNMLDESDVEFVESLQSSSKSRSGSVENSVSREGYFHTDSVANEIDDGTSTGSLLSPWRNAIVEHSLAEFHASVAVPTGEGVPHWRRCLAFVGPGLMVSVGYMDPGNWSTDIAGGSAFGFKLLFIISLSSLIAMFLQRLALKCGFATGRDLAQCCRDSYPKYLNISLWIVTEMAIIATDLAEVIGSAVALKLLFGIPLGAGVAITMVDILLFLYLQGKSIKIIEYIVGCLILLITVCFAVQMGLADLPAIPLLRGFLPPIDLFRNKDMLLVATGIIGATVMPHNLFLHSSLVLSRNIDLGDRAVVKEAIRYATFDSTFCLVYAWFVNAAILIVAAGTFHANGYEDVATLEDAYHLLEPILGHVAGSTLFAIALLASGQNATLTGTLCGQIVMEGFMSWRVPQLTRRIVTRLLAIVPALLAVLIGGDGSVNKLLIFSQVTLSFALPFAIFPLVHITSSRGRMGTFVNSWPVMLIAYAIGFMIVALNIFLVLPSNQED